MAKRHEIAEALQASVRWPPDLRSGGSFDATIGWFRLQAGEHNLTHYRSDNGQQGDEIQIPLYDLAEWLSLNWWSVLFEPKKTDYAEQDLDFRARHWLGYARNGFALPDAWFVPVGGKIEVESRACYLRSTRLHFTEAAHVAMPLDQVSASLANLLNDVATRLSAAGVAGTVFQDSWRQVCDTPHEAQEFCRMIGALGLSPYDEHREIEELLDQLTAELPSTLVQDLCEALDAATLLRSVPGATRVWEAVGKAPEIDISKLAACPLDETTDRAAQWGLEAAWCARKAIGVNRSDPMGGDAFFEALGLTAEIDGIPLVRDAHDRSGELDGAVQRLDDAMRMALTEKSDPLRRRFAGARAAFLAWSGRRNSSRLLTDARTRDQQASRAFAAEILAPISYIRAKAYQGNTLSNYQVGALAHELRVSPAVIENQAKSHRIFVSAN